MAWPEKNASDESKGYWKISFSSCGKSLKETNTFLISPGGTTFIKFRIEPDEPPSSDTVTIAVISAF